MIQELTQLTYNAIKQLFFEGNKEDKEYIVQIVGLSENYKGQHICIISDGYCKIKGQLVSQCKTMIQQGDLDLYEIIGIRKDDIIINSTQNQPNYQLHNCHRYKLRIFNSIGIAMPYIQYRENNFQNNKGSIIIAEGQNIDSTITIEQLINCDGRGSWVLKAKVISIPPSINRERQFLIVMLLDRNGQVIQGLAFGKIAIQIHKKLLLNHQYLFSNALLQRNKNNFKHELKFMQQTKIIPLTIKNDTQRQQKKPIQQNVLKQINQKKKFKQIITNSIKQLVDIVGKIITIQKIKGGTCYWVIDQNQDGMQIIIWDQCYQNIQQKQVYLFTNLRPRKFNDKITLHSTRDKTKIILSQIQINKNKQSKQQNIPINITQQKNNRDLINLDKLINVSQLSKIQTDIPLYRDVIGYLMIKYTYLDQKIFFMNKCQQCDFRQININPLSCGKCFSYRVSVKLNIRAIIIDCYKQDIRVVINQQLAQKLLGWKSKIAFQKYKINIQQFKKKIILISNQQYLFKMKINPSTTNKNLYYNLLDFYNKDPKIFLLNSINELKNNLKLYNQERQKNPEVQI